MSEYNVNLNSTPEDSSITHASDDVRGQDPLGTNNEVDELIDPFDDEFLHDDWDEDQDGVTNRRKPRIIRLFCFECNRPESHFLGHRRRWYYSFLVGLSFGLALIAGPFRCRCCGKSRLMCADWLHPKRWFPPKG